MSIRREVSGNRLVAAPPQNRRTPLALLGVTDVVRARALESLLRGEGAVVTIARGDRACLRMAAALHPDIILLDPALPRALLSLLRAHPLARRAHVAWSQELAAPCALAF
jgi:CheY-like chemotaxis protein